jgi:uncharacterized protein YndB with AHSA1/START domain/ribosomal protein S18 acetylase RimI-like enzyme
MGGSARSDEIELRAAASQVWEAITTPQMTRRYYFGLGVDSDWRAGSPYAYRAGDGTALEEGQVVESVPGRRLRLTSAWRFARAREEPPHEVTWEIEPVGERTRVRLTRSGMAPDSLSSRLAEDAVYVALQGLRSTIDPDVAAQLRRLDRIGEVAVEELTPARLDHFLDFFDHRAFVDHPAWSGCYCMAQLFPGSDEEWALRTGRENREEMSERIRAGRVHGLLAYVHGQPAGWCHAGPRVELLGLRRRFQLAGDEAGRVGSVACFVIAAPYRRHGVARRLLDAACGRLARLGLEVAEAYPLRQPAADADAYRGPLSLYLAAGFEPFRETPRHLIVRKSLGAAGE